jgi:hypothetical protein
VGVLNDKRCKKNGIDLKNMRDSGELLELFKKHIL